MFVFCKVQGIVVDEGVVFADGEGWRAGKRQEQTVRDAHESFDVQGEVLVERFLYQCCCWITLKRMPREGSRKPHKRSGLTRG